MAKGIKEQLDKYLEEESLQSIMESTFGRYSKYIIQDRALPDIRDGLKPVQRRILYAMWMLNLKHNTSFKKSARVIGEVIGKYHPHGETSVYSAMIRLAQNWKTPFPLVDVHGNKGSIDGDPPAAMRYTEARLSPIVEYMLGSISYDTVPFIFNFDDSEIEPTVLPSYLPNYIINGSKGIASGYATNTPPHNLGEVIDATKALIKNPNLTIPELMTYIKGPDFPTYGTIYGIEEIHKAYTTGLGNILIRATIKIVLKEHNKKQLHIIDIPFEANKPKILKKVEEFIVERKIIGLKQIRDESDRNGISIVIDLDPQVENINSIIGFLYKHTELQKNFSVNLVGIANRKPKQLTLKNILLNHISHMEEITIRKSKHLLAKAKKKLEIINGLIKAISILDKVIKIIRKSKNKTNAINNLKKTFNFTLNQATAIVNLRLYRLTSTDIIDLRKDEENQKQLITHHKKLSTNAKYLNNHLLSILSEIKKKFAIARKTQIQFDLPETSFDLKEIMKNEEIGILVTRDGYVKRLTIDNFREHENDIPIIKNSDSLLSNFSCMTKDILILITSKGNYITLPLHKLLTSRWQSLGEHINKFSHIDSNEKIIATICITSFNTIGKTKVVLVTKNGMIKVIALNDFQTFRIKKARLCMTLKNHDEVVSVFLIDSLDECYIITKKIKGMKISLKTLPLSSLRSQGNIVTKLKNDTIVFASNKNENFICTLDNKKYFNVSCKQLKLKKRGLAPERFLNKWISQSIIGVFQKTTCKYLTIINKNNFQSLILDINHFQWKQTSILLPIPFNADYEIEKIFYSYVLIPKVFRTNHKTKVIKTNKTIKPINESLRQVLIAQKKSKKTYRPKLNSIGITKDISLNKKKTQNQIELEQKKKTLNKSKSQKDQNQKKVIKKKIKNQIELEQKKKTLNKSKSQKDQNHKKEIKKKSKNQIELEQKKKTLNKSKSQKDQNQKKENKNITAKIKKNTKTFISSNIKDNNQKKTSKAINTKKLKKTFFKNIKKNIQILQNQKLFNIKSKRIDSKFKKPKKKTIKKTSNKDSDEDATIIDFKIEDILGNNDEED